MTRKRYVKLKMAEGLSRNEANQNAREIVAEGRSYQEDYNDDLGLDVDMDLVKVIENMRPVIENMVETTIRIVRALSAGVVAFNKAFVEAM